MSTSMLNHTFGIPAVQYSHMNFWAARPYYTAACTAIISNVPTANPGMSFAPAR